MSSDEVLRSLVTSSCPVYGLDLLESKKKKKKDRLQDQLLVVSTTRKGSLYETS